MSNEDLSKLRIDKKAIKKRKNRRKRLWLLALFLLLILAGELLYLNGALTPAVTVQVASVQKIYPSQTLVLLNASGYVVAQRKAALAAKMTGCLEYLAVEEGDRVEKGQIIARLESLDMQAAVERAEANVNVAQSNIIQSKAELEDALRAYRRRKDAAGGGYVAQTELEAAEARYLKAKASIAAQEASHKAALAQLREAQINLSYSFIRAPFDAVVLTKNADVGDIVTPLGAAANAKAAVVTIADMSSLQVEVDVSESNIDKVNIDQPCEIQLDALPDKRFKGKVHKIVPTADRSKASVLVKIAFLENDPKILPEMGAKVAFLSRELSAEEQVPIVAIPAEAVIDQGGVGMVYVVQDGRAESAAIRTGRRIGAASEVLAGVNVGDKVILAPLNLVEHGAKVKLKGE